MSPACFFEDEGEVLVVAEVVSPLDFFTRASACLTDRLLEIISLRIVLMVSTSGAES